MELLHKKNSKLFLPQIFFIVQRKRKCQEDETSEKFTSMSCFLHALSTTKASRKSIFIFFSSLFFSSFFHFPFSKIHCFFFFFPLYLHDCHMQCFTSQLSPSLLKWLPIPKEVLGGSKPARCAPLPAACTWTGKWT